MCTRKCKEHLISCWIVVLSFIEVPFYGNFNKKTIANYFVTESHAYEFITFQPRNVPDINLDKDLPLQYTASITMASFPCAVWHLILICWVSGNYCVPVDDCELTSCLLVTFDWETGQPATLWLHFGLARLRYQIHSQQIECLTETV